MRRDINAVVGIPLLKVFFIVDQPWWEDNRPSNRFAADLPTREIYYWKSKDKSKGVLMVYTDRPALQFWTDYLDAPVDDPRDGRDGRRRGDDATTLRQEKAATWLLGEDGARSEEQLPNRRLWQRFVQYARDYEHNDFTADRLHRVRHARLGQGTVRRRGSRLAAAPEVVGGHVAHDRVRSRRDGATNVHVCGDAYSDYQGFIEGALRSTARVLTFFVTGEAGTPFDDSSSSTT